MINLLFRIFVGASLVDSTGRTPILVIWNTQSEGTLSLKSRVREMSTVPRRWWRRIRATLCSAREVNQDHRIWASSGRHTHLLPPRLLHAVLNLNVRNGRTRPRVHERSDWGEGCGGSVLYGANVLGLEGSKE